MLAKGDEVMSPDDYSEQTPQEQARVERNLGSLRYRTE